MLHNYFDYKLKAPILTDAFISDDGDPNGRTGKGLISLGLKYMLNDYRNNFAKNYVSLNGKNFDHRDKHRYSEANNQTTLVHIEDLKAWTNIEDFFNDITEGVDVDEKNEKPYKIKAKILFSTNKTIKVNGDSAVDRTVFFELSDYYSSSFSPEDDFKHWFFKEWNEKQWQLFDFFMVKCVQIFLKEYKIITADTINLQRRTLLEHSSPDFVNFLDFYKFNDDDHKNKLPEGYYLLNGNIELEHDKKELFNSFLESYPEYARQKGFNQARFTKWIKLYAKTSELIQEIQKSDERRSSNKDYITFKKK